MSEPTAILEAVLRKDRWFLLAGLLLVVGLAFFWLLLGAGTGMSAIEMTRMAGMDGWLMTPAIWTPGYAALIFSMWWVMMVAMMLPSAAPMLLLFARVNRSDKKTPAPLKATALFALGYLLVWGFFSALATALQWGLEQARLLSPMMESTNVWLGAGILIAAGAWQVTPLKAQCLKHCRSPLSFLMTGWRSGPWGALQMGARHGAYCLGCCWFLMALLFFGGVMNLFWIVGLAAFVFLEKTVRQGHWLGRIAGVLLIACGLLLPFLSAH